MAALADTTIVVLAPGLGDGVQAAKAGLLEVGDVYVVNKADRDGADDLVRDLRGTVRLAERKPGDWRQPIVPTVATRGEGVDELAAAVARHREWLGRTGELDRRRHRRVHDEIEAIVMTAVRARFGRMHGDARLDTLAEKVLGGHLDPYAAADEVIAAL